MESVGIRALRQDASGLIRRVEGGEEIEITVAGRTVVRMVPAKPGPWRRWDEIADLFQGQPDTDWARDRDMIDHSISDPWIPSR